MARIYDKKRQSTIEVSTGQAESMAKYKPERYELPAEVEDEVFEEPEQPAKKKFVTVFTLDEPEEKPLPFEVDNSLTDKALQRINDSVDATFYARELANENGVDLRKVFKGKKLGKKQVQNYIDGQN